MYPGREVPYDGHLVDAGHRAKIPVDGNQLKTALAWLTPKHRDPIVWFYEHGREHRFDIELFAGKLNHGRDPEIWHTGYSLYQLFLGRVSTRDMEEMIERIKAYREYIDARERIQRPRFVTTDLTKQLFGICDRARSYEKMMLIFGDGQIGKSKGLEEYARVNKQSTRYLRLPTQAPMRLTLEYLAQKCHLNTKQSGMTILKMDIIRHFDRTMLLIVDELQQISLTHKESDRLRVVKFLRELHDRSGCGVVLCGTNEAMQEIEAGPNLLWLRRLRRRAMPSIILPDVATDDDILVFAAHFGFKPRNVRRYARPSPKNCLEQRNRVAHRLFSGCRSYGGHRAKRSDMDHFLRTVTAFSQQ